VVLQIGLVAAKWNGVEVKVEAKRRVTQWYFGDHGGDEPLGHDPLGFVGIVSRVRRLGQDVESREQPSTFIVTQVANMVHSADARAKVERSGHADSN
jgi:hypothetical protein